MVGEAVRVLALTACWLTGIMQHCIDVLVARFAVVFLKAAACRWLRLCTA